MKVILYLGQNADISNYNFDDAYVIGVDKGALVLSMQKIKMDLAVGDFDSITEDEYKLVLKNAKKIKKLNPIKDESDTASAVEEALKISNDIEIIGGINGARVEHLLSNLMILAHHPNIEMIDDSSKITVLEKSRVIYSGIYRYVSFFALEDSIISLDGFKYNLFEYPMKIYDPLGLSNEIESSPAQITINSGKVLMILSKNDLK